MCRGLRCRQRARRAARAIEASRPARASGRARRALRRPLRAAAAARRWGMAPRGAATAPPYDSGLRRAAFGRCRARWGPGRGPAALGRQSAPGASAPSSCCRWQALRARAGEPGGFAAVCRPSEEHRVRHRDRIASSAEGWGRGWRRANLQWRGRCGYCGPSAAVRPHCPTLSIKDTGSDCGHASILQGEVHSPRQSGLAGEPEVLRSFFPVFWTDHGHAAAYLQSGARTLSGEGCGKLEQSNNNRHNA